MSQKVKSIRSVTKVTSSQLTKGQIEATISEGVVKFELEYMGRGPTDVKTYIIDDMVFMRLKGVLTPAERKLAASSEGATLIKQMRLRLLEDSRLLLEELIKNLTGADIISMHTDISTRTGERVIIFTLDKSLEGKF
ncbi:MAG: DUF2294 domain-containing protein [bacterium]|nr:DUF2294 domain-containing protein [bacterium]